MPLGWACWRCSRSPCSCLPVCTCSCCRMPASGAAGDQLFDVFVLIAFIGSLLIVGKRRARVDGHAATAYTFRGASSTATSALPLESFFFSHRTTCPGPYSHLSPSGIGSMIL